MLEFKFKKHLPKQNLKKDIINLVKSTEHSWFEVSVLNQNSSYVIGIFYQPSSIEHGKTE